MKISAKTEYACLAMLELAEQYAAGSTVRASQIAERHGIPPQFLIQILQVLKSAGLVRSSRGTGGGYRLDRPPAQITLAEIIEAIDGPAALAPAAPQSPCSQALVTAFEEAAEAARGVFDRTSLAELAERSRHAGEAMFYI